MRNELAAAGFVLALGAGAALGFALRPAVSGAPAAPSTQADAPAPDQAPTAGESDTPAGAATRPETHEPEAQPTSGLVAENSTLRGRVSELTVERDTLARDNQRLSAQLEPFLREAALRAPVFTFGKFGALDGVANANWQELSVAARTVSDTLREIRALQAKGEPVPVALQIRQQQYTEMVRKYEYATLNKLPSAARHNGELTHPISHCNLIAGACRAAGLPLSDDQLARMEALGLKFEADFEAAQARYDANTPRCEKLLDELVLKGAFSDAVWAVLTPEQLALFVTPETLHVAGTDLYCPTLIVIHTKPVLTGADAAEIRAKLHKQLTDQYKIGPEHAAAFELLLDQWLGDVTEILVPVAQPLAARYTLAQAVVALRATTRLAHGMRDTCGLDTDRRAALLDAYEWYMPRVIRD